MLTNFGVSLLETPNIRISLFDGALLALNGFEDVVFCGREREGSVGGEKFDDGDGRKEIFGGDDLEDAGDIGSDVRELGGVGTEEKSQKGDPQRLGRVRSAVGGDRTAATSNRSTCSGSFTVSFALSFAADVLQFLSG